MKVLILIDDLGTGGLERMLLDWLRFKDKNTEIQVAALFGLGEMAPFIQEFARVDFLDIPKNGYRKSYKILDDILRQSPPDIAVCMREGARALFPAFFKKRKISVLMRWDNTVIRRNFKTAFLEFFQIRFADGFQTCSAAVAKNIKKTYPFIKDVDIVPNGVDLNRFKSAEKKPGNLFRILSVGNFREEKCHEEQLEIARILIRNQFPFELHIAGDGERRHWIEKKIIEFGLGQNVQLLGRRSDIPDLMTHADLFLITSKKEAFTVALLEAMAANIPILVYDLPLLAEIDPSGECFQIIKNRDTEDAAKRIISLSKEPELRKKISEPALIKVRDHYSIQAVTRLWENSLFKYAKGFKV